MKAKISFGVFILCCFLMGCGPKLRQPDLFLVPDGYVGWLQVDYEVQNAPALPVQNGYRVCKFDRSGKLATSSTILYGMAKDKTYYVTAKGWKELTFSANGGSGMLWAGGNTLTTSDVFVGTWNQFKTEEKKE